MGTAMGLLKWWLIVAGVSVAGIVLVLAWDWLVYRRWPHVRWLASQMDTKEMAVWGELTRVRRRRGEAEDGPRPSGH
jgi:hypothetical protein